MHWEFTKQSKEDYKTHTKSVDIEPLKNTQHSLVTPHFLETLLKPPYTNYTKLQCSKEGNKVHTDFIKQ